MYLFRSFGLQDLGGTHEFFPVVFFQFGLPSKFPLFEMDADLDFQPGIVLSATLFVSVVMCYGDVPFRLTLCSLTIGS